MRANLSILLQMVLVVACSSALCHALRLCQSRQLHLTTASELLWYVLAYLCSLLHLLLQWQLSERTWNIFQRGACSMLYANISSRCRRTWGARLR